MIMRSEKIQVIKDAIRLYTELDAQWRSLHELAGAGVDSPLGNAIWKAGENMITNAAMIADDTFGILHWFVLENECGKKKLKHSLPNSKRMIVVKDIETLLRVMGY